MKATFRDLDGRALAAVPRRSGDGFFDVLRALDALAAGEDRAMP